MSLGRFVCRNMNDGILRVYDSNFNSVEVCDRESEDLVFEYGDNVLFSKRKDINDSLSYELVGVDLLSGKSTNIKDDVFPLIQFDSKLLLKKYGNTSVGVMQFDLKSKEIDWDTDTDLRPQCIGEKIIVGLIGRRRTKICGVLISNGRQVWEYDLSNLGSWIDYDGQENNTKLLRSLGIYLGYVYLYLNNGRVLVLDIETGEKINLLDNSIDKEQISYGGAFFDSIDLDEQSGKLIQLFSQKYTEVDLSTEEIQQLEIDDLRNQDLENKSLTVFDTDSIYFSDRNKGIVAEFRRSDNNLGWSFQLSENAEHFMYGRTLRLSEESLYVLDNFNTLHIFKKQNQLA